MSKDQIDIVKKIDELSHEFFSEMRELRAEMRGELRDLRSDIKEIRGDLKELKTDFSKNKLVWTSWLTAAMTAISTVGAAILLRFVLV